MTPLKGQILPFLRAMLCLRSAEPHILAHVWGMSTTCTDAIIPMCVAARPHWGCRQRRHEWRRCHLIVQCCAIVNRQTMVSFIAVRRRYRACHPAHSLLSDTDTATTIDIADKSPMHVKLSLIAVRRGARPANLYTVHRQTSPPLDLTQ